MNFWGRELLLQMKKNNMEKKKTIILLGMNKGRWPIAKDQ
jgi:hypothetical protein